MDDDVTARLTRIEATLERLAGALEQAQPQLAMAVDIADDWVRERIGGDAVEERLSRLESSLLRLTEPATIDALTNMAAMAPELEPVVELASGFEDHVAMATDIADDWVREYAGGDGIEERLRVVREALLTSTTPEVLSSVVAMAQLAPSLLRSAHVAADLDPLVAAMTDAFAEPSTQVGMFGALGALRDPDVQRGVGRAIAITRHLGRNDNLLPIKR